MNATLMKRLFRVLKDGSVSDVSAVCRRIVDEQKKRGHTQVAKELENILSAATESVPSTAPSPLRPLPTSRRDSAPLLTEIPVEKLRHHMVLPVGVEGRFARIEQEFAARSRLAKHGLKPRHRILLYGPPGCGKNLGAERLAWHTGLPLLKVRFDNLLSSYFGETMTNLRRVLMRLMKRRAPFSWMNATRSPGPETRGTMSGRSPASPTHYLKCWKTTTAMAW